MNTHTIKHTQLGAAAALLLLLCGCPAQFGTVEGPGARGTITLAQGVSSAGYRTLVLRAAPDAPQDPAAPRFPPNHGGGSSEAELALRQGQVLSLASLSMPYDFALGGDYGTSQTERWRVFAWLSWARIACIQASITVAAETSIQTGWIPAGSPSTATE